VIVSQRSAHPGNVGRRNAKDPREAVARDLIQLVAVQKAFEACATRIKIPQANGMKGARPPQFIPRYYDIGGQMDHWILDLVFALSLVLPFIVGCRFAMVLDSTARVVLTVPQSRPTAGRHCPICL
jgi:hypothetical protein